MLVRTLWAGESLFWKCTHPSGVTSQGPLPDNEAKRRSLLEACLEYPRVSVLNNGRVRHL